MKVKFLEGVAGTGVAYYPGDEADLPDGLAQRYIAQGTCAAVVAKVKRTAKRETAAGAPRELAIGSE